MFQKKIISSFTSIYLLIYLYLLEVYHVYFVAWLKVSGLILVMKI